MSYIYDLSEDQVNKLFLEWNLTNEDKSFETEKHLKNSFILFVKNNASIFKQVKPQGYKTKGPTSSENVFSKLLAEELEKENQNKP